LAVHHVDDAALRGDPRATVPGRHPPRPGRHLPRVVATADGEPVQHLPDEAVHPDAAHRAPRRSARRRGRGGAHLLGGGAATGPPRAGLPRHHLVRGAMERLRVAIGRHALQQHAHPAGRAGADTRARAAVLRPAHGGSRAGRHPRDRNLLRLPALPPPGRYRGSIERVNASGLIPAPQARPGVTDDRPAFGFDLAGVLMVNPFASCVVPRLERLLAAAPSLTGLTESQVSQRVRGAIRRGWQRRMTTGDLAAAYDWDAIYREAAQELGAPVDACSVIDVGLWVRECCAQNGHVRALEGVPEMLSALS